ncbi:glycerophosphodiester phosphodiesterase family protein [Bacteroides pyogenes F0041]|uniref:Glycerophosphodiester phosphodiesterase family protein n=1 Tax=Bacteroides pyogenes F0041 TaxID=1321819 RepID=U2CFN1_9BACE|nr:glycerophosphodiester phosphodiesterase family protein [Bacteroides pyogenes]ERI89299.1 glycerophosphodiester phosphodiesterase family protein [Bacteroides pyogenes F0041]
MKLKKMTVIFALMGMTGYLQAQHTQVVAHRGFWKVEGSAQNSIAALREAESAGCYGSEFDVWLTKDNKSVVNHDPVYKMKSMEGSKAEELTKLRLENGEKLPLLEEYFDAAREGSIRLILELKKQSSNARETRAVREIVALAKRMGLERRMEYISFSLHAVKEFIRLAPEGTPVYYLNGDLSPAELKAIGCSGPDYHLEVFKKHPEWIRESHELGMKVNAWTVDKPEDMRWLIERKADFITTNEPLKLREILKEYVSR